NGLGFCSR
ncbi:hypothetical protein D039_4944B, partial [Vibrio parahaemolyticus EKP-028]